MNEEFTIRKAMGSDKAEVIGLWESCGLVIPPNDPHKAFDLKMGYQGDLFLIGLVGRIIAGTVMAGFEGRRGWINYLGVLPQYQGRGYGTALVERAVHELKGLGCPKVNIQIREGNLGAKDFYEKLGFSRDPVISYGRRL